MRVNCECGARLRAPGAAIGKQLQCPQCQKPIQLSAELSPTPVASPSSCPICQTVIGHGETTRKCNECDQVHHQACWTEIGGCSTYGCRAAPILAKDAPSPHAPTSAWGDTK